MLVELPVGDFKKDARRVFCLESMLCVGADKKVVAWMRLMNVFADGHRCFARDDMPKLFAMRVGLQTECFVVLIMLRF